MNKNKKIAARILGLVTAFTLLFNSVPVSALAKELSGGELPKYSFDFNSIVENTEPVMALSEMPYEAPTTQTSITVSGPDVFMTEIANHHPNYYQNVTIEIYSTTSADWDLVAQGFKGLGSSEYPFKGSITFGTGGGPTFVLDTAFFNALDVSATIPTLNIKRKSGSAAVLTEEVTNNKDEETNENEDNQSNANSWTVNVTDIEADGVGNQKIGSVLGNVASNCSLTLNYTNSATGWEVVTNSAHVGLICNELGSESQLTVNYTGTSAYNITSTEGSAGGLVGYMHAGTEVNKTTLTVNDAFAYSGNVTAGNSDVNECSAGGIVGYAGDYTQVAISSGFNCNGTINAENNGSSGGIAGYVGENSTVTLSNDVDYTVTATATNYAGGLVGYLGNGSTLALSSTSGFTIGGTKIESTGTDSYSGGLIGYTENPIINFPTAAKITVAISEISGTKAAGGLVGYAKLNSAYNFDTNGKLAVSSALTLSGEDCGGFFGCLENNIAGQIGIFGEENNNAQDIGLTLNSDAVNYGGIIGRYTSTELSNSLVIQDIYATADKNNKAVTNYGGLIGSVNGESYISTSNVKIETSDSSASNFGGIAGYVDNSGSFIDILGDVSVNTGEFSGTNDDTHGAGGLVGYMESGVIRINGAVDLSYTSISDANASTGIVLGRRNNTLVYIAADGTVTEPSSSVQANNVGNWGGVISNTLVGDETAGSHLLTYSSATHTVTIHAPNTTISNEYDYALLSLNIQLNTVGDVGALQFSGTQKSAELLAGEITLSADIDLTDKGLIGLTRDDGSNAEFRGTFNGNSHTLTLGIGNGEPDGKIYTHTYNGLFAKTGADATISNVTIAGTAKVHPVSVTTYAGGIAAHHTSGSLTISGVTTTESIEFDGDCRVGGMIATVDGGEVEFNSGCRLDNAIANFDDTTTNGDAYIGGLIAEATGATIRINDITADKLSISVDLGAEEGKSSGGFLGYKWLNTESYINKLQIGVASSENTPSLFVKGTDSKIGGLVYRSTGFMQINGLDFQRANITGTPEYFGMLVCYGDTNENNALYLELVTSSNDNKLDNYKITVDNVILDIGIPNTFDEFVAKANGGSGIVSIPTSDGKGIYEDDVNNIYQNRLKLGDTVNNKANSQTRYYYNLDTIRTSPSSPGEQLLLWSVKQYSHTNLNSYFNTNISTTIGGERTVTYNLTGLSYYPVNVPSDMTISNATVIFDSKDITYTNSDNATIKSDAMAASGNQDYEMQRGLFNDLKSTTSADRTLTINGTLILQGAITKAGGTGALICGTVAGTQKDLTEYSAKIVCGSSSKIILKDLYVRGYSNGVSPLLINSIGSYTNVTLNGVKTDAAGATYYTGGQTYAASSLIGNAGGETATSVNLTFSKIALDARTGNGSEPDLSSYYKTNNSIFSHATLLESYRYASKSSGNYDFTREEDWQADAFTTAIHNVTYGKEIKDSVEYANQEQKYLKSGIYVSSVSGSASAVYDFANYLPYVYQPYSVADNYHELKVNLSYVNLEQGCGTYGDPYIISDADTLDQITKLLSGEKDFQSGFNINYPANETDGCFKNDGEHDEYTSNGAILKSGTKTKSFDDMREYLRNAYYLVTDDITLPSDFLPFGKESPNAVNTIFRGVIVGRKADGTAPTITLETTTTPFIQVAGGCVVKDINFTYLNTISLTQDTVARFAPENGASNTFDGCEYFGGVIGQVLAGDNVIDNVSVTFSDKITVSGDKEYLIPVGAHVGVVRNGGLIFRNMSTNSGLGNSTVKNGNSKDIAMSNEEYLYVNSYVGRVLDGFVVTDDGSSFGESYMSNGSKNYAIVNLDSSNVNKISLNAWGDKVINYLPKSSGNTSFTWSSIQVPNAQSLFVLSAMVASGAVAYNGIGDATPFSVSSFYYYTNTSYNIGNTRLANYTNVGNATSSTPDFTKSKEDRNGKNSTGNQTSSTSIPYLIKYYTQEQTTHKNDNKTEILDKYPARIICAPNTRFTITLKGGGTYDMPKGFRGINAMFNATSYSDNPDRQVINMFGFNGNGATVELNMDIKTYGSNDAYNPYGVGLITRFQQNTNGEINATLAGADTKEKIESLASLASETERTGFTVSDVYSVKDMTISGRVSYSVPDKGSAVSITNDSNNNPTIFITKSGTVITQQAVCVGGIAGRSYDSNGKTHHYWFENITVDNLILNGGASSGALMGAVADFEANTTGYEGQTINNVGGSTKVNKVVANNINVKGITTNATTNSKPLYSGGLFGIVLKCTNYIYIDGNNKDYKIGGINAAETNNICGGMIGYTNKKSVVKNFKVQPSGVDAITIGNTTTSEQTQYSGGIIGRITDNEVNIENCTVDKINFTATVSAGGAIGEAKNGTITDVAVSNSIITAPTNAGGVVGKTTETFTVNNTNVTSANVIATDSSKGYAGGVIGKSDKATNISDCTVTSATVTATTAISEGFAGGVIGSAGGDNNIENVTLTNSKISAYIDVGGIIGNTSKATNIIGCSIIGDGTEETGTIIENTKLNDTNTGCGGIIGRNTGGVTTTIENGSISGCIIKTKYNAGGVAGRINNILKIDGFSADNIKINISSSGAMNTGGLGGRMNYISVCNTSISKSVIDSENCSATNNNTEMNLACFFGYVQNSCKGYNLLINDNTFNLSSSTKYKKQCGNIIGKIEGTKIVQLVGISKQGNGLLEKDIFLPNKMSDDSYLIFADYQGSCIGGNTNGTAPYVTVNPALKDSSGNIIEVVDSDDNTLPCVSGDGMSKAAVDAIIAGSETNKAYTTVSENSSVVSSLTSYSKICPTSKYQPFYVYNIESHTSEEIAEMVEDYVALLTNSTKKIYTIDTIGYKRVGNRLVKTTPSISYEDGVFKNSAADYDTAGGFTIIDVQYADPNGDDGVVFHLMIPVYAKKQLQFTFRAAALSGTDYNAQDYASVNQPVVSAYGSNSPITAFITFSFDRSDVEWAEAINNGENLMIGFEEYVYIQRNVDKDFIPVGTKLTLVDKNDKGKSYTYTLTNEETIIEDNYLKIDFAKFEDSSGNHYNKDNFNLSDLLDKYGTLTANEDANGTMVVCSENDATIKLSNGTYLKPATNETPETVQRYTVSVAFDEGISDVSDAYYLTFQTPDYEENAEQNNKVITNFIVFTAKQLQPAEDGIPNYNATPKDDSYRGGTLIIGNFFNQTNFTVTTLNDRLIDPYSNYQVKFSAETTVEIRNASDFWGYTYDLNIYHEFGVSLLNYVNNSGTATEILGSNVYVNDTTYKLEVTKVIDTNSVETEYQGEEIIKTGLTYNDIDFTSGQDKYYISPTALKEALQNSVSGTTNKVKEFKISVISSIIYGDSESIKNQFPLENGNDGIAPRVTSNFAFSTDQLRNSDMSVSREIDQTSRYYRSDSVSARISYDEIQTGFDETGCASNLGINAFGSNDSVRYISARGLLDTTNVANIDAVERIRFTIALQRKDESGSYVDVDIDDFIPDVALTTSDGNVVEGLEKAVVTNSKVQKVIQCTYSWNETAQRDNKFDIVTDLTVYTGHNDTFEGKNWYYSNYNIQITAELLAPDKNGTYEAIDTPSNHLVYTNSRIYYEIVP